MEPYCDLENLSLHGLVAFLFQNLCNLPSSGQISEFLDTVLELVYQIVKVRKEKAQVSSPSVPEQGPVARIPLDTGTIENYRVLLNIINTKNSDASSTCSLCGRAGEDSEDIRRHTIISHLGLENWVRLQPGLAAELKCSSCSTQFLDQQTFILHYQICSGFKLTEKDFLRIHDLRTENLSNSNFCPECRRTLPCKENFLTHIQNHADGMVPSEADYACSNPSCSAPASFISSREARMYSHIKMVELRPRYSCSDCDTVQLSQTAYEYHMKIFHLGLDLWEMLNTRYLFIYL